MRKYVFALALIAASSSMAFAAEATKDKAHISPAKATTMSDADMDKVTAGFSTNQENAPNHQPPGFIKNFIDGHSHGKCSGC